MTEMPKRLIFIAVLLFPAIGVVYLGAVTMILELLGCKEPIWNYGWKYFYMFAISAIGLACYTTWSLLRFRSFGRWAGIGVSCTVIIFMVCSPVAGTHFKTDWQIMLNRCMFAVPFMYATYYLLSRSFRHLYSKANEERLSVRNNVAEQTSAGDSSTRAARVSEPPEK